MQSLLEAIPRACNDVADRKQVVAARSRPDNVYEVAHHDARCRQTCSYEYQYIDWHSAFL